MTFHCPSARTGLTAKEVTDSRLASSLLNTRCRSGLLAATTLVLGCFFYAALRPSPAALLNLSSLLGFWEKLWALKETCASLRQLLPAWAIYSLPDGLWLISLLAALDMVWSGHPARDSVLRSCGAMAILYEVAQAVAPRLGTFDPVDLVALVCGAAYLAIPPLRSLSD